MTITAYSARITYLLHAFSPKSIQKSIKSLYKMVVQQNIAMQPSIQDCPFLCINLVLKSESGNALLISWYNFHCYRRQWQNLSLLLKWLNFSHSAIFPLWFPVFTQVSLQNKRFQCMITTVPVILQTSSTTVKTRRQRIPISKPKNTNTRQRIRVQQCWWGNNRPRSPLYLGNRGRMDYVRV